MRSRRTRWMSGLGAVVLIGGLILANYGSGVMPAEATGNDNRGNPFRQILNKLNEILDKLNNGGGNDGHHTLRWDQNLPAAQRFVVLAAFANAVVLDRETGLVWEQAPQTTSEPWSSARFQCTSRRTGGREGWRLPSVHELASLIDPSVAPPGPTLPPGHPFTNVQSALYWSASTFADFPTGAWFVGFNDGFVGFNDKTLSFPAWCVRGGMNADAY